ncbi:MAG TPA: NrfD/PsrC family molybdoenzyme membrane anchor subunit [Kofleriaceae bacterium]|nr:NrfD/PsrC family molybdoenzyme membrane anchor subunit [Kofleriaceae bacterium]
MTAPPDDVLIGRPSDAALSDQLLSTTWRPFTRGWKLAFAICGALTILLFALVALTVMRGIGVWGNQMPVAWGFGIINFVWWIGIGHAGTFISAILLLLEQRWRTSINRFTEGMTLFAVMQAGLFPLLHLGRPWFAYWLFPYPSVMDTWPQVRSALPWDAAAVSTYLLVSVMFWYLGLIPDLAALRDRAPSRNRRIVYGILALGWRGSVDQWRHHRVAYLLLAGLATPLVLSVHSIVSLDFASTALPGWHSTIFPPFFVAGAILSGFAMVLTLIIPARRVFKLHNVITLRHFDAMAKLLLVMSWIATYSYAIELFVAWYSDDPYERYQQIVNRPGGWYAWGYWLMLFCNCVVTQVLWSRRMRRNLKVLFVIGLLVNLGMWLERFEIIVVSLSRDFLPSAWREYTPTWVDLGILLGTLGFFGFLFLGFLRLVPFVPVAEMKQMRAELTHEEAAP